MADRLSSKTATQFSAAAAAGLLMLACNQDVEKPAQKEQKSQAAQPADKKDGESCCMGLNECKGKGGCAVPESNACAGKNECKGKGGCNMHCPK